MGILHMYVGSGRNGEKSERRSNVAVGTRTSCVCNRISGGAARFYTGYEGVKKEEKKKSF